MKKSIKLFKKVFVIISVIWTTVTFGFIGIMAFSGPSSCSIDSPDSESVSEKLIPHETDAVSMKPDSEVIVKSEIRNT